MLVYWYWYGGGGAGGGAGGAGTGDGADADADSDAGQPVGEAMDMIGYNGGFDALCSWRMSR